jgi:hypothetical protein
MDAGEDATLRDGEDATLRDGEDATLRDGEDATPQAATPSRGISGIQPSAKVGAPPARLVGMRGLEPPISCSQSRRPNR